MPSNRSLRTGALCVALAACACEGPRGERGPAGPVGPKGDTGPSGIQGPPGNSVESQAFPPDPSGPCPHGGTRFLIDGQPVGTACHGAPGAQGIVAASVSNGASSVGPSYAFAVTGVQVVLGPGQKALVTGTAALGTSSSAGASGLDLIVCSQNVAPGSPIEVHGTGSFGLFTSQPARLHWTLSHVITAAKITPPPPGEIPPGTYLLGLCAKTSSPNWTNNEWGSTSVVVMN